MMREDRYKAKRDALWLAAFNLLVFVGIAAATALVLRCWLVLSLLLLQGATLWLVLKLVVLMQTLKDTKDPDGGTYEQSDSRAREEVQRP